MATFNEKLKEIEFFLLECIEELRDERRRWQSSSPASVRDNADGSFGKQQEESPRQIEELRSPAPAKLEIDSNVEINSNLEANYESQDCNVLESCAAELNGESMVGSQASRIDFGGNDSCDTSGHSTMELEVGEEATQPDAMEDKSLTILGPILEDSSGEFSGIDGTDERQSTSLLFEPPILQSAVFNDDAMGLNRPSFLEGFKSENPSNPRLDPTPSNLGVRLNRVELEKEDHGVNGSRVLHTEMNNTMEDYDYQDICDDSSKKVASNLLTEFIEFKVGTAMKGIVVCDVASADWTSGVKITSTEILGFLSAHKLFDELPKRKTEVNSMNLSSTVAYLGIKIMVDGSCLIVVDNMGLVFDPGGVVDHERPHFDSSYAAGLVHIWSDLVWVFDPGGGLTSIDSCSAEFC